jgi:hypothetical protein
LIYFVLKDLQGSGFMNKQEYEFHPIASVLPMLGQADLNALAADIQGNGLRHRIVLLDGKILDGRNRYKACQIVGVQPEFREFNGDGDPIAFIISENLCRRHLTASQKALAVAKIADLPRGNPNLKISENANKSQIGTNAHLEKTIEQAALDVDVSPTTVKQAKRVLHEAPKETIKQIERGEKSVATAVKEIKTAKAQEEAAKEKHRDKTGYVIPESIYADWQVAESFRSTLNDLQRIKLLIEKAVDKRELIYREVGQDTVADLKNTWTALKQVLPYAVCPTCQGRTREKCSVCKQRGFVSEFGYTHWFAKEVIELRERAIRK